MKCIAGLGNPGEKYLLTRHNIGFMVVDALGEGEFRKKHESLVTKLQVGGNSILLVKPQTYMNLSGKAIREIVTFYRISLDDLLVIQDDIDQPFLHLKFQKNRGHGGHNGIRNIHKELGTSDYARLKLGIGRGGPPTTSPSGENKLNKPQTPLDASLKEIVSPSPLRPEYPSPSDYVLSPFSERELSSLKDFLFFSSQAVLYFMEEGFKKAANKYNGGSKKPLSQKSEDI